METNKQQTNHEATTQEIQNTQQAPAQQATKALFIIINAGFADEVMEVVRSCGARGGTIFSARGSGAHAQAILGVYVEPEKEVIISIVDESTAQKIMEAVKNSKGVSTEVNGVCFLLPVCQMSNINKIQA